MGAIASPFVVDPVFELNALWDGAFPNIDSEEKLDEVTKVFLQDFWSALAAHADTDAELPFALTPLSKATSTQGLKEHAQVRGEEIDAFLNGFYQDQENLELDEDLGESLDILDDLLQMYTDLVNTDEGLALDQAELSDLSDNMLKMTDMAEMEINNILASCA